MRGKLVKVRFRRRRESKTNYRKRYILLKSNEARLVIRKTNRYIITQIVKSKEAQDSTLCYVNSKELEKLGWSFSFKNIPAAYLTGFLIAKKAKEKKIKKVIIDVGLYRSTKGSKLYAVIKGVIDGGLEVSCKEEILPSEERIKGKYTKKSDEINKKFNEIKEKISK